MEKTIQILGKHYKCAECYVLPMNYNTLLEFQEIYRLAETFFCHTDLEHVILFLLKRDKGYKNQWNYELIWVHAHFEEHFLDDFPHIMSIMQEFKDFSSSGHVSVDLMDSFWEKISISTPDFLTIYDKNDKDMIRDRERVLRSFHKGCIRFLKDDSEKASDIKSMINNISNLTFIKK